MPFNNLDVRVVPDGKYVLLQPLRYNKRKGVSYTIPKGFKTDFASIPQGFRWLITGHDQTRKPAVLHDYLYRKGIGTKKNADTLFKDAMKEEGTPWYKRHAAYLAVHLFGRGNFKEK